VIDQLTPIPHAFRSSSRLELVTALQETVNNPQVCRTRGLNHREIAQRIGVSESTWKRARGVGGDWHKVDIYVLLKYISLYSPNKNVALVSPSDPNFFAKNAI